VKLAIVEESINLGQHFLLNDITILAKIFGHGSYLRTKDVLHLDPTFVSRGPKKGLFVFLDLTFLLSGPQKRTILFLTPVLVPISTWFLLFHLPVFSNFFNPILNLVLLTSILRMERGCSSKMFVYKQQIS
jgi:hypothetical protein